MFLERRRIVEAQMEALKETLELIDHKCHYYETAIEAGTERVHQFADRSDSRLPCEE